MTVWDDAIAEIYKRDLNQRYKQMLALVRYKNAVRAFYLDMFSKLSCCPDAMPVASNFFTSETPMDAETIKAATFDAIADAIEQSDAKSVAIMLSGQFREG